MIVSGAPALASSANAWQEIGGVILLGQGYNPLEGDGKQEKSYPFAGAELGTRPNNCACS